MLPTLIRDSYKLLNKKYYEKGVLICQDCENGNKDEVKDEVKDKIKDEDDTEDEYGTCCLCGDYCNPMSQSCGRCARDLTMTAIGMK